MCVCVCRYDGQEGTISHMSRQQSGSSMQSTESVTGTSYGGGGGGGSDDLSSPGNISASRLWKLSPQASSVSSPKPSSSPSHSSSFSRTPKSAWFSDSSPQPQRPTDLPYLQTPTSGIFDSRRKGEGLSSKKKGEGLSSRKKGERLNSRKKVEGIGVQEEGESVPSVVEEDRYRVERLLEIFRGPCLLDCIEVNLSEVDVFSAKRVPARGENFRIERERGNVLKEKGAAKLFIERNLYEDFCRDGMYS